MRRKTDNTYMERETTNFQKRYGMNSEQLNNEMKTDLVSIIKSIDENYSTSMKNAERKIAMLIFMAEKSGVIDKENAVKLSTTYSIVFPYYSLS